MSRKFDLPFTTTALEQEAVYTALRKTAARHLSPRAVSARRIAGVCVVTEGEERWVEVGKQCKALRERVMAIFQPEGEDGPVLVLTPSHGVWRGEPHTIPAERIIGIREFRG